MDALEQLVFDADVSVAVFGRGEQFVLVSIGAGVDADAARDAATAKGYSFCGVLALKDGVPEACIESTDPRATYTMLFAGLAFAHQVADKMRQRAAGDGAEWLARLFALEDPRA